MQIVEGFLRPGLKNGFPGDEVAAHPAASVFIECGRSHGNSLLESVTAPAAAAPQQRPGQPGRATVPAPRAAARLQGQPSVYRGGAAAADPLKCNAKWTWCIRSVVWTSSLASVVRSQSRGLYARDAPAAGSSTAGISAGSARTQDARSRVRQSRVFPSFLQGKLSGLVGAKL